MEFFARLEEQEDTLLEIFVFGKEKLQCGLMFICIYIALS